MRSCTGSTRAEQNQARIHHLRRRRIGDVAHLVMTMVVRRKPWGYLDEQTWTPVTSDMGVMLAGDFDGRPDELVSDFGDGRGAVQVRAAGGHRRLRGAPATVEKASRFLRGHVRAANPLEPIDAVYLWVDRAAPGTGARLSAALANRRPAFPEAASEARFRNHGELRYSLRSLERFAPWVRRVHVVTDGEPPPWLALGDRCTHVTHDQIFSERSCAPSFNSLAIEWQLHRVPGLTRRFLYFNDDMLLGRPVGREHYLDAGGRPVVYFDESTVARDRHSGTVLTCAIAHTAEVTEARLGDGSVVGLFAHTPQLLDCELLRTLEALWPEEYQRTSRSTFRAPDDLVLGVLYPAAALAGLNGSPPARLQVLRYGYPEYSFVQFKPNPFDSLTDLAHVERTRPRFVCVNDDLGSGALSDRLAVFLGEALERMYPVPSRYEFGTESPSGCSHGVARPAPIR
jgi:Stealth protein CR2, conserved region 2/Stealth protein CR3, conserved region 3